MDKLENQKQEDIRDINYYKKMVDNLMDYVVIYSDHEEFKEFTDVFKEVNGNFECELNEKDESILNDIKKMFNQKNYQNWR